MFAPFHGFSYGPDWPTQISCVMAIELIADVDSPRCECSRALAWRAAPKWPCPKRQFAALFAGMRFGATPPHEQSVLFLQVTYVRPSERLKRWAIVEAKDLWYMSNSKTLLSILGKI
jgi:hypothetical protein